MNHTSIIKVAMSETKTTQTQLAKEIGLRSSSVVSERIGHTNISVKKLLEILEVMGYEVVVQPKPTSPRPDEQMVLRLEDYEG